VLDSALAQIAWLIARTLGDSKEKLEKFAMIKHPRHKQSVQEAERAFRIATGSL
jgi:hypothetical protein